MLFRLINITLATIILIIASPIIFIFAILIYLQDFSNPFYLPNRVGKDGKIFKMIKLRSMIPNADLNHVDSTKSDDNRITKLGSLIRSLKIDEFTQFVNVIIGDMNIIGPRPNVKREVDIYTIEEKKILHIKPGITDLSSIVFSDLGDILKSSKDPNITYNQLVRPWKSRLCLFYVNNKCAYIDIKLFFITIISFFNRKWALNSICKLLGDFKEDEELINICSRDSILKPAVTVGANKIIHER